MTDTRSNNSTSNSSGQDSKHESNKNPGNFANDPQRAAEAGRKGGQS